MKKSNSVVSRAKQKKSSRKADTKPSVSQEDTEIISLEELEERGGIIKNKSEYLMMHLKLLHNGTIHLRPEKSLIKLTQIIEREKLLYVSTQGGYKLMKSSSINADLRGMSSEAKESVGEDENSLKKTHPTRSKKSV